MTRNSVKIYCYLHTVASIQSRGREKPFDATGCLVNSLMSSDLSAKSRGPSHDEYLFRKKAHLTKYRCSTFLLPHGLIRFSLLVDTLKQGSANPSFEACVKGTEGLICKWLASPATGES